MSLNSKGIGEYVGYVALAIDDAEQFAMRSQEVAEELGQAFINPSKQLFHSPPPKPDEASERFEGLGEWMSACQNAIIEVWFHNGSAALPALRKVAFGEYDWIQAVATRALCRLALQGVDPDYTCMMIAQALPTWRYEQVMRVYGSVAELALLSTPLMGKYEGLIAEYQKDDPEDAFDLISALAFYSPEITREKYGVYLRDIALGPAVGDENEAIEDIHNIRTAVLLRRIAPDDVEVEARIKRWSKEHADASVRDELSQFLLAADG